MDKFSITIRRTRNYYTTFVVDAESKEQAKEQYDKGLFDNRTCNATWEGDNFNEDEELTNVELDVLGLED